MRKLSVAAAGGLLAVAASATALAQPAVSPSVTVKAKVSPNRAGTRAHPQGIKLNTTIRWQNLGPATQPIVQTFDILFPKGALYNGGQYSSCSYRRLNNGGPVACPKASIMGSGTGNAYADTVITHPKITVVNGGKNTVFFFTVLNNPARVQSPVIGRISKIGGKYAYKLHVVVPQILQIVAGIPIALTYLNVTAGRASWLATTSCGRGGHWPFSVTTSYSSGGSSSFTDSIACRK
jgi:hypothetical protein